MSMNPNYYCVIMAGGVGARFWPMSRTSQPKQFIDILGSGHSLLQETFNRLAKVCPRENIFIATNDSYRDLVQQQLPELSSNHILCEPCRRNTAPCIAYATYKIASLNPKATIVVAPSDHVIRDEDAFVEVIQSALESASQNAWLVTLGMQPDQPHTGYGYIQFDESTMTAADNRIKKVVTFTEKPPLEMARQFLQSGDFLWNSGIFIWSAQSCMDAFRRYLPEMADIFEQGRLVFNTSEEGAFINKYYPLCKNISVDYGILEKAGNAYVLSAEFGWSDLGTWSSLYEHRCKDDHGNAIVGSHVMAYDAKGCIVNMPKDKLVVIEGLEDYIVAEDQGMLLICRKGNEQRIRDMVSEIGLTKGEKYI